MNQRGFIPLIVLFGLLVISSVGLTGFLYLNKKSEPVSPPIPTISPSPGPNNTNQPSALPTPSNRSNTTQPSPSPTIKIPTSTPQTVTLTPAPTIIPTSIQTLTPTAVPTPKPKPVCSITVVLPNDAKAPFQTSICTGNNSNPYQNLQKEFADLDGDGNWDYQGAFYGCHTFTFQTPGTYSPRAKIVNTSGEESDVCQTSVTIN